MNVKRLGLQSIKPSFILFLLFCSPGVQSQIIKINCIEPREITLPVQENQTTEVHYVDHNGHTFWYRIMVTANCRFSYHVGSILDGGSYEVQFYEFNGVSFCKDLVRERVEPVSSATSFAVKAKKGDQYYLGIDHSGPSCGHEITFELDEKKWVLRSAEHGSPCANKDRYERPDVAEKKQEGNVIIGGRVLSGKVRNALTEGSINADLQFTQKEEDYEINTIAYRLKGYSVHLEKSKRYQLQIRAMGYLSIDTIININADTELDFRLKPVETGGSFIVENIYFYPNTFACKPESREALETLKDYMLENKKIKIEIQGHTNGNKDVKKNKNNAHLGEEWNYEGSAKELSKLRADKLRDYLAENGISRKRIVTVGKGGDEMIVPHPQNMDEAAKNIRVEIKVLED